MGEIRRIQDKITTDDESRICVFGGPGAAATVNLPMLGSPAAWRFRCVGSRPLGKPSGADEGCVVLVVLVVSCLRLGIQYHKGYHGTFSFFCMCVAHKLGSLARRRCTASHIVHGGIEQEERKTSAAGFIGRAKAKATFVVV